MYDHSSGLSGSVIRPFVICLWLGLKIRMHLILLCCLAFSLVWLARGTGDFMSLLIGLEFVWLTLLECVLISGVEDADAMVFVLWSLVLATCEAIVGLVLMGLLFRSVGGRVAMYRRRCMVL